MRAESDLEVAEKLREIHPDAKRITIRYVGTDWYEYTVMEDEHEED